MDAFEDDEQRCRETGMDGHRPKHFEPEEVRICSLHILKNKGCILTLLCYNNNRLRCENDSFSKAFF